MRTLLFGLMTFAALGLVSAATGEEKASPPVVTSEAYQVKVVNEAGADILVRAVSFNRNWDAIEVKKGDTYSATDERHYFRKGEKVFIAYDAATKNVIALKEVDVTGPTIITVTGKDLSAKPLASR